MLSTDKNTNSNIKVSFFEPKVISIYYNWDFNYTNQVIFEYERFMILRATNPNLSPSNSIDKL